jgi:hypothetical protein
MLNLEDDYFVRYKREIRMAAEKVTSILNLNNWIVRVGFPMIDSNGIDKWQVDFFDSDGHWHGVSFEKPPDVDESWYIETIKANLKKQLGLN